MALEKDYMHDAFPKMDCMFLPDYYCWSGRILLCVYRKRSSSENNNGQLQLRLREPQGTRLEVTERLTKDVLSIIDSIVDHHVAISSAYVGIVPSSFGASNLYVFNSGTHEAVIQINLDDEYKVKMEELKETIRKRLLIRYPGLLILLSPLSSRKKSWRRAHLPLLKSVWPGKIWKTSRTMQPR